MRFVYTKGPYLEYRGHVFCNGNPVTILDKHTETLLQLNPDFRKVEDEKEIQEAPKEVPKEITGTLTLKRKPGRPARSLQ